MNRYKTLDGIDQFLAAHSSMVATVARREVARIRDLTRKANQLERDPSQQVTQLVPSLLKIPGCRALSAAKFIGEAADIARFKPRDAYAIWAGVAPIPMWSAKHRTFGLVSVTAGLGRRIVVVGFHLRPGRCR